MKFAPEFFVSHISSSYAKILGETNFQPQETPRSGSKAKEGEKDRELVITIANFALQCHLGRRTQSCLGQKNYTPR